MVVDHTKVAYTNLYGSYANIGVYEGVMSVGSPGLAPGASVSGNAIIQLENIGHYATALVQTNDYEGSPPYTSGPLRWVTFPPGYQVYIPLTTDPYSAGVIDARIDMAVRGNVVTFLLTVNNPYDLDIAFNNFQVGFQYSVHTLRDE